MLYIYNNVKPNKVFRDIVTKVTTVSSLSESNVFLGFEAYTHQIS